MNGKIMGKMINPYQAGLFGRRIGRGEGADSAPLIYWPIHAPIGTQISRTWSQMKADIFLHVYKP